MINVFLGKMRHSLKKKLTLFVFLVFSLFILLLSSTLIFKGSSADILLIFMIWCLPLFIH